VLRNRLSRFHVGFSVRILRLIIIGNTGIVDQEMNPLGFLLLDFIDEALNLILTFNVSWSLPMSRATLFPQALSGGLKRGQQTPS
jgi:hypothetical protein